MARRRQRRRTGDDTRRHDGHDTATPRGRRCQRPAAGDSAAAVANTKTGRRSDRRGSEQGVATSASPRRRSPSATSTAENGVLGDAFAPAARGMRAWAAAIERQGRHPRPQDHPQDVRRPRGPQPATWRARSSSSSSDKVFALVGTNTRTLGGVGAVPQRQGHSRHRRSRSPTASPATRTSSASTRTATPATARRSVTRATS